MFASSILNFLGPGVATAPFAIFCILNFGLVLLQHFDPIQLKLEPEPEPEPKPKPKPKTTTKTQDVVARWQETTKELAKVRSEFASFKSSYIQAEHECADAVSALNMMKKKLEKCENDNEALRKEVTAAAVAATAQAKYPAHDHTTCPNFKLLITQNRRLTGANNDQGCIINDQSRIIDDLNRRCDILSRICDLWRANNAATVRSMRDTIVELQGELAEVKAENERLTHDLKELISTVEELTVEQQVWEEDLVVVRKDEF